MESGDAVLNSWLHVFHLRLNLQEGTNDLEFVAAVSQSLLSSSTPSTTLKIRLFVKGVWWHEINQHSTQNQNISLAEE